MHMKLRQTQRQIPFKNNNFIPLCRQIKDHTPTQSLQIMDIDFLGNINESLIDDIPKSDGKPVLYFDWILKLENIAAVTMCNPMELDLGKA